MIIVARVILRIDLERLNTRIMDSPGTVVEQLYQSPDDFWGAIAETPSRRLITGKFQAGGELREINIQPAIFDFSIEFGLAPQQLETLNRNGTFNEAGLTIDRILKVFESYELRRVGIRLFCLSSSGGGEESSAKALREAMPEELLQPIHRNLGEIRDIALIYEGQSEDEIGYRISFGPHKESDVDRHLLPKSEIEEKDFFQKEGYDMMFDIDFYDQNIDFKSLSVKRWAKGKLEKAEKAVQAITRAMTAMKRI